MSDPLISRRHYLTLRAIERNEGTSLFTLMAVQEAVASTAMAHPEWDMDEERTWAEWMADEEKGPDVSEDDSQAADADDTTDPRATCTVRRRPLWPGQKQARCDKPYGHWPKSDHHWVEVEP